jgi:hypothetical protein
MSQVFGNALFLLSNSFMPHNQDLKFFIYGSVMIASSLIFLGLNRNYDSFQIQVQDKKKED